MLMTLLAFSFAMGAMSPPEDANKATKNAYRFAQRTVNRFITELSFFYNPKEFAGLLSGGMFPAIGVFTDLTKFIDHLMMEFTGLDISDPTLSYDEVVKKAHPVKYGLKLFPGLKATINWGAIISSDFAEELDITIQKENKPR